VASGGDARSCFIAMKRTRLSRLLPAVFVALFSSHTPAQEEPERDDLIIETWTRTYGPLDLEAERLQQTPPRMELTFPEDLWLVGFGTEIVDSSGNRLSRELQCHTFLGTSLPVHHSHDQVAGLFSDGYTENFRLPSGFGIFFKAGQTVFWTPMFNNRATENTSAAMKITLEVVRDRYLKRPLQELTTTFRTIQVPDLYYVPPGRDVRETTFDAPFVGRIHAIGTHIHPYGVSIELINVTREESVWKAVGRRDATGNLVSMPTYTSREGYSVHAGDRFKLIAVYENTSDRPVDAMAGMFILYVPQPAAEE
jgi:hypothetical protein